MTFSYISTMKIYTKSGDEGLTSLLGGTRVSKSHIRVEAYGTVDELNAHLAHLKDQLTFERFDENIITLLHDINKWLFDIGSLLALEHDNYKGKIAAFNPQSITQLELQIDQMTEVLPPLRAFILPGGHPQVSFCHICRTVCRRAERKIVALHEQSRIDTTYIIFMNRLSDYLFTLARYIAWTYNVEEDKWHE